MKSFTMTDLETRCKTSSEKIVSRTDFSRRQLATAFSPLKCLWAFSSHLKSLERRNKSLILLDSIYEIIPKWWKYWSRDGKLVIAGDMMIWCKTWRQRDSWCLNIVISLSESMVRTEEILLWGFVIIICICFYRPRWSSWTCMEVYCGIFANASWCYALF